LQLIYRKNFIASNLT